LTERYNSQATRPVIASAAQMPIGAYSCSARMPRRTIAVSATMVTQITYFQKLSHWETAREKTGGGEGASAAGAAPVVLSGGAARSRNSPQCLHFLAMARITSPQKGQRRVASGTP